MPTTILLLFEVFFVGLKEKAKFAGKVAGAAAAAGALATFLPLWKEGISGGEFNRNFERIADALFEFQASNSVIKDVLVVKPANWSKSSPGGIIVVPNFGREEEFDRKRAVLREELNNAMRKAHLDVSFGSPRKIDFPVNPENGPILGRDFVSVLMMRGGKNTHYWDYRRDEKSFFKNVKGISKSIEEEQQRAPQKRTLLRKKSVSPKFLPYAHKPFVRPNARSSLRRRH